MRPANRHTGVRAGALGCAALLAGLLAACTSSGSAGPSSAAASGSTTPGSTTSGTTTPGTTASGGASSTPPGPTATSTAPTGLAGLDGTLLLAGPTAGAADVYEVTGSTITRRTHGAHLRAVAADTKRVVVSTGSSVEELRGDRSVGIGLPRAFSAALSTSGELAWLTVQGGSSTPGVSKPKGFAVHVRAAGRGAGRIVYRSPSSLGPPAWVGTRALVVAVAPNSGPGTEIVRVDVATGRTRTLAALDGISALDLTVGTQAITATSDDDRVLVISNSGDVTADTALDGSMPLCWTGATSLLTAKGATLRTVTVSKGKVGTARTLGTAPAPVYGASCARVAGSTGG